MVDSRQKGATAETTVRNALRDYTGLQWERVPGSGALDPKHQLKGDLYVPGEKCLYCVEVKHYKDNHLDHTLLSSKTPQILAWWQQCIRQAEQVSKEPLLIFKFDRSKLYAAFKTHPTASYRWLDVNLVEEQFYIALLEDWITKEIPEFIA